MSSLSNRIKANRLLYQQLLFAALAFAAMTILSYIFMSNIVRASVLRNANNVLGFAEDRINSKLREFDSIMGGYVDTTGEMARRGDSPDEIRSFIDNILHYPIMDRENVSGVRDFYVYLENVPGGPVFIQSTLRPLLDESLPTQQAWYQQAVQANGELIQTMPYINSKGETIYTYAQSILDESGNRLGVVCMDAQLDVMGTDIVSTALTQGGYGMLLNQDGLTLFHPNADYVGRQAHDPVLPFSIYADEILAGEDIIEKPLVTYNAEDAFAFFRTLDNDWRLGLVTPKNQFYRNMTMMAVVLCLLGITLAVALMSILVRINTAKEHADEESKQKSMFLANMSHEIRTPINAIVGMTAIGRSADNTERKDYCFSKIDNASKHLLGVINDILDMSKIAANKIELAPTDFNFEKMLQQTVNVINFRVDEKHQKFSVRIDQNIPHYLFADDQRLTQVITNLLSNAVKFTPDYGSVRLKAALLNEEDGKCVIKISVQDTGIGISPEQQTRLFQSFQQAESMTTRTYGGTGLGLAISKSIVNLMGGEIWVESELGKGTTFSFTVEVAQGKDLGDTVPSKLDWKNIRILTVDDDLDILAYFKDLVTRLGASCDVANSAEDALRMVDESGDYNIYFVDLRMPNVDGISLTQQIRAREKNPGTSVVIMITSADLSAVEESAKKAGVNKFLLKPLFPSSIADVISECIGVVQDVPGVPEMEIDGIFAGHRVLFAEDIDINREIVMTLLEPTSIEVVCAENGLDAVQKFREAPESYDMIFMDIQMPEMDGYEATRQIRAMDFAKAKEIPIVAMTANVFREDIASCLEAGMNGHLGKPLDLNEMLNTTIRYLGKQESKV